ncbi:hypothetical protein CSQ89_18200 [Chitinimonas sp. BJB300]|nr:hypothetical protein CSQ89_18200 [Chitinimonas sp. BJB300]
MLMLLSGCDDGSLAPVQGTALPVPGTETSVQISDQRSEIQSTGTALPIQANTMAARFTGVAPATTGNTSFTSSPAIEYQLGNLVAQAGTNNRILITPVRGWVRYPLASTRLTKAATRFPVIVFLHGQHDWSKQSYQGYDYLAKDLAAQGYVVISIDANAINRSIHRGNSGDTSSRSRAQLVLGTLDRLREIDKRGGPGMLDQLKGKLDFTRIGIMGHSRGGQGIANALKYNLTRVGVEKNDLKTALLANPDIFQVSYPKLSNAVTKAESSLAIINEEKFDSAVNEYNIYYAASAESTPPYHFKAAFLLAPTDFSNNLGLVNVPLATLLPSCDGDVINLDGSLTYDRNRFSFASDTSPRYQILVRGANHNFYNTIWTRDDYPSSNLLMLRSAYANLSP